MVIDQAVKHKLVSSQLLFSLLLSTSLPRLAMTTDKDNFLILG